MRNRLFGAALAAAAMLLALPASADNYPVRDGTGAAQTFCSKVVSGLQYPCHLLYGLFGSTPTPIAADASGNLNVNVQATTLPAGAATAANQSSQLTQETASAAALGTTADAAWSGSGSGTTIAINKAIYNLLAGVETIRGVDAPNVAGTANPVRIAGSSSPTSNTGTVYNWRMTSSGEGYVSGLATNGVTAATLQGLLIGGSDGAVYRHLALTTAGFVQISGNSSGGAASGSTGAGLRLLANDGAADRLMKSNTLGDAHVVSVQGSVTVVPTVTASSAYASGAAVGGLLTVTGAVQATGSTALLQKVVLNFKSAQTAPTDVLIFSATPASTTVTDKSAFSLNVADFDKLIGVVHVSDCTSAGTPSMCQATGLALSVKATTTANLFAVLVTRGTPTFTATSDVSVNFQFIQD